MKNRYNEIVNIYKHHIILFKGRKKLDVYKYDKLIFKYYDYSCINDLQINQINYLILDNLSIEEIYEAEENEYDCILLKSYLLNLIERGL